MEGMELKGTVYRIRKCAFDLLSMEDDLIDDDEDSWELMGRDLSLKSTFLYCDLNRVIASSLGDQKKALTDLANRLFYYMEEVLIALVILSFMNIISFHLCLTLLNCSYFVVLETLLGV